ncbi:hypothetical protein M9H77_01131 [Catharanthus roseus]|uniref:Uncharacterized protein n=1 Tax=Catharanthus roseus TaxID=4058 RepID=A0ACC0C4Y5_CATRO|nr:hypothetical protein M9H77_01131 [Catharanthus roseus]
MALFYLLFLALICTSNAQSADPTSDFCNITSKINSPRVSANIDNLLAELVSTINTQDGFTIVSKGENEDQVYGLAQCRGDIISKDCLTCIQDASKEIRKRCPDQSDARIWYDYCFLRYDNKKFFGQSYTSFGIILYNLRNVTEPDVFNKELGTSIDKIRSEALNKKAFATGKSKISNFINLYALVQCTRDLSQLSCAQCLAAAIANFPRVCKDKEGCQVLYSSCYVRYEIYPFFFPLDPQEKLVKRSMKDYSSLVLRP